MRGRGRAARLAAPEYTGAAAAAVDNDSTEGDDMLERPCSPARFASSYSWA